MVRATSVKAIKELIETGTISKNQSIVLKTIYKKPNSSDQEILKEINKTVNPKWDINTVRPRRNELMHKELVKISHVRKCSITGKTVYTWKVI